MQLDQLIPGVTTRTSRSAPTSAKYLGLGRDSVGSCSTCAGTSWRPSESSRWPRPAAPRHPDHRRVALPVGRGSGHRAAGRRGRHPLRLLRRAPRAHRKPGGCRLPRSSARPPSSGWPTGSDQCTSTGPSTPAARSAMWRHRISNRKKTDTWDIGGRGPRWPAGGQCRRRLSRCASQRGPGSARTSWPSRMGETLGPSSYMIVKAPVLVQIGLVLPRCRAYSIGQRFAQTFAQQLRHRVVPFPWHEIVSLSHASSPFATYPSLRYSPEPLVRHRPSSIMALSVGCAALALAACGSGGGSSSSRGLRRQQQQFHRRRRDAGSGREPRLRQPAGRASRSTSPTSSTTTRSGSSSRSPSRCSSSPPTARASSRCSRPATRSPRTARPTRSSCARASSSPTAPR